MFLHWKHMFLRLKHVYHALKQMFLHRKHKILFYAARKKMAVAIMN
jgi:hypothetical protein